MSSASDTVTNLAGLPDQTIAQALDSAASLNDDLWNRLIPATPNPALQYMLTALQSTSAGDVWMPADGAVASTEKGADTISTKGTSVDDDCASCTDSQALGHASTAVEPTNASVGSTATDAEAMPPHRYRRPTAATPRPPPSTLPPMRGQPRLLPARVDAKRRPAAATVVDTGQLMRRCPRLQRHTSAAPGVAAESAVASNGSAASEHSTAGE
jgi:hypothetical protein